MIKKWLGWINRGMSAALMLLVTAALAVEWARPSEISAKEPNERKRSLPGNSFALEEGAYERIGDSAFVLNYVPPKMQLPDLRKRLLFYGKNDRPDAEGDGPLLHLAFTDRAQETVSVAPGERLYFQYEKDDASGKYCFSPGNRETSLWLEAEPEEKEAFVTVHMLDENGRGVSSPEEFAGCRLKEREFARSARRWEIGKWRVDGTLLARQRARWYGEDCFLKRHGGEEYSTIAEKQRIDFGDKEELYSVYLSEGDAMIWNGERWEAAVPGEASRGYPLMVVKKIDDRLMNLELWDAEGKKRVPLNLLRFVDSWVPNNIQDEFRFLGARTRSQYVFEVENRKMLLRPHDWLLLTESGWKKITTPEEVDDYVERKEVGTLFVFDGMERQGDQQVMKGSLYSKARAQVEDVSLVVQKDGLVYREIEKRSGGAEKRMASAPNGLDETH